MNPNFFKEIINKIRKDTPMSSDEDRRFLYSLPDSSLETFMNEYLKIKEVHLKEAKFNLLERYLNYIKENHSTLYIQHLKKMFKIIEYSCLFYKENIITPFVSILLDQNKNVLPEDRKKYLAILAGLSLQCYLTYRLFKEDQPCMQIMRGYGGRSKSEIIFSASRKLPKPIVIETTRKSFLFLSEHLISLLRSIINLRETTIENTIFELFDIANENTSIRNFCTTEYYGEYKYLLLSEWERQFQYQKSIETTLAEFNFPKELCQ